MKRGEIWLVGLDPMQGHEQKGRRPVLIVSPEAFKRVTKVPIVLPITRPQGVAPGGKSSHGPSVRAMHSLRGTGPLRNGTAKMREISDLTALNATQRPSFDCSTMGSQLVFGSRVGGKCRGLDEYA
jgi:mRNA-degrading endonuclease toxin of MazEF toxin-antitoxin module